MKLVNVILCASYKKWISIVDIMCISFAHIIITPADST